MGKTTLLLGLFKCFCRFFQLARTTTPDLILGDRRAFLGLVDVESYRLGWVPSPSSHLFRSCKSAYQSTLLCRQHMDRTFGLLIDCRSARHVDLTEVRWMIATRIAYRGWHVVPLWGLYDQMFRTSFG
jgi:hypothetical protein